jgi:hypothetical protein
MFGDLGLEQFLAVSFDLRERRLTPLLEIGLTGSLGGETRLPDP